MLSQTIPVAVTGDTAVEDDESFFVDLSGAVGADVLDGRGIGTILNDDAPTLSVSTTAVAMGESVQVTVADGPGDRSDWVSLAEVGSAANSYLDWLPGLGLDGRNVDLVQIDAPSAPTLPPHGHCSGHGASKVLNGRPYLPGPSSGPVSACPWRRVRLGACQRAVIPRARSRAWQSRPVRRDSSPSSRSTRSPSSSAELPQALAVLERNPVHSRDGTDVGRAGLYHAADARRVRAPILRE